ncbi:hypothetical protein RF11_15410 [Thelohanellus kitauei]|uniref:Uncharacterized protein n=1 Tax=Thelohanellus kitauei TaxID=669202 RepID=A0A0C2MQH9_THEKT|nr:hypothetical protein RF11_15410 [Thelohanellus kitauei]
MSNWKRPLDLPPLSFPVVRMVSSVRIQKNVRVVDRKMLIVGSPVQSIVNTQAVRDDRFPHQNFTVSLIHRYQKTVTTLASISSQKPLDPLQTSCDCSTMIQIFLRRCPQLFQPLQWDYHVD